MIKLQIEFNFDRRSRKNFITPKESLRALDHKIKQKIKNNEITFNELVNLLKDAYINQKESEDVSDFYVDDNVEKWNIVKKNT